ncbi:MAG: response regulator [Acidobacteriota bacterium]
MAKTILLADDSMTIQKVVELTFMDQDFEVITLGDGATALERYPEVNPDLVIADVHMPGADGYEVCRRVKAQGSTPVLLLVGTFEPFDEGKAREVGADAFLKKPFDSQELLSRVEALVSAAPAPGPEPVAVPTPPPVFETPGAPVEVAPVAAPAEVSAPTGAETRPRPVTETAPPVIDEPPSVDEPPVEEPAADDPGLSTLRVAATGGGNGALSDDDVERIARRVVELLGDSKFEQIVWDIVPDLAELVIRERISELESQVE